MEIHFPDEVTRDPIRQTIRFPAEVGRMPVDCHISRRALEEGFDAEWEEDAVDVFLSFRDTIERAADRLIREGRFEKDKSILIGPEDLQ